MGEGGFPKDRLNYSGKKRGWYAPLREREKWRNIDSQNTTIHGLPKSLSLLLPSPFPHPFPKSLPFFIRLASEALAHF